MAVPAAVMVAAPAAHAAPAGNHCVKPHKKYPPKPRKCGTIHVENTVRQGGRLHVEGHAFQANEDVDLELSGPGCGHEVVNTRGNGQFSTQYDVPDNCEPASRKGETHTLTAFGLDSGYSDSEQVQVRSEKDKKDHPASTGGTGQSGGATAGGSLHGRPGGGHGGRTAMAAAVPTASEGHLPFGGVRPETLLIAAVMLGLAGGVVLSIIRRRRSHLV